jgi:hypothetical protein
MSEPDSNPADAFANIPGLSDRRIVISEDQGRIPAFVMRGIAPLAEPAPIRKPQVIEDRRTEIQNITRRLLAIIEEHRVSALRIGFELDRKELGIVIDALEAETRGEDPHALLATGGEILSYILTALYEELLAEPSNILHVTQVNEDTVRYEAMEVAFWQQCLASLKQKLDA